jgi:hypothetical protein
LIVCTRMWIINWQVAVVFAGSVVGRVY